MVITSMFQIGEDDVVSMTVVFSFNKLLGVRARLNYNEDSKFPLEFN